MIDKNLKGGEIVKIVFISNFLNHHQLPLCNAFLQMEQVEFKFVATEPVSRERLELGYSDMDKKYDFVIRAYLDEDEKIRAVREMKKADVLISGGEHRKYLNKKERKNKLVFLYLERTFKKQKPNLEFVKNVLRAVKNHTFNRNRCEYILCAGAYVAPEFKRLMAYRGRMYKWGYFPEIPEKKEEEAEELKNSETAEILWAGRMIKYKRPRQALEAAKELKRKGYQFTLNMIGSGELENAIREEVLKENLETHVHILKSMPPHEVRNYMDRANIFLFTSNEEEGWGAVLNEAMSSRCAVVANRRIGAVPFLLEDHKNGLIYDGTTEDLLAKTEELLKSREKQRELGEGAYRTMITQWNAGTAAEHFVQLSEKLLAGGGHDAGLEGPCSYIG